MRWFALGLALLSWLLLAVSTAPWGPRWRLVPGPGALLVALQQWCAIVAVLGFSFVHLNADGPLRRFLTEAVFPVYVLHQTVIILLAWSIRSHLLPPALEGPLLVVSTFVLCFAVFAWVRRWRWTRPLFGLQAATP